MGKINSVNSNKISNHFFPLDIFPLTLFKFDMSTTLSDNVCVFVVLHVSVCVLTRLAAAARDGSVWD